MNLFLVAHTGEDDLCDWLKTYRNSGRVEMQKGEF